VGLKLFFKNGLLDQDYITLIGTILHNIVAMKLNIYKQLTLKSAKD